MHRVLLLCTIAFAITFNSISLAVSGTSSPKIPLTSTGIPETLRAALCNSVIRRLSPAAFFRLPRWEDVGVARRTLVIQSWHCVIIKSIWELIWSAPFYIEPRRGVFSPDILSDNSYYGTRVCGCSIDPP
jgi:hypothetical protein